MLILGSGMISCSSMRPNAAPLTPFIENPTLLHPWAERAPWDLVWSADPGKIMVKSPTVRKIYVAPVNLQYLNKKRDQEGNWVGDQGVSDEDAKAMAEYLGHSFLEALNSRPDTNLKVVNTPGPDSLTLAMALVELSPTVVAVNAAADVGGLVLPGSKLIEQAGSVGVQAAGGEISGGQIAFEMKLIDGRNGAVLAEAADREVDKTSVLPNYRDFEEYGWSRETCDEWASQFVQIFDTSNSQSVEMDSRFSFVPW